LVNGPKKPPYLKKENPELNLDLLLGPGNKGRPEPKGISQGINGFNPSKRI